MTLVNGDKSDASIQITAMPGINSPQAFGWPNTGATKMKSFGLSWQFYGFS